MNEDLIYPDLSYDITGVLFQTHNELGRYCNEKQYADKIEELLKEHGISFTREYVVPEKGEKRNRIDFLVEEKVVLEIKAKRVVEKNEYYQVKRYLEALDLKLGLLSNFRDTHLKVRRILNSKSKY